LLGESGHLIIQGALKRGASLAPSPAGDEARPIGEELRVLDHAQDRGHEDVGGGEFAGQVLAPAEPVGLGLEATVKERNQRWRRCVPPMGGGGKKECTHVGL
jgi:hypothetical protein